MSSNVHACYSRTLRSKGGLEVCLGDRPVRVRAATVHGQHVLVVLPQRLAVRHRQQRDVELSTPATAAPHTAHSVDNKHIAGSIEAAGGECTNRRYMKPSTSTLTALRSRRRSAYSDATSEPQRPWHRITQRQTEPRALVKNRKLRLVIEDARHGNALFLASAEDLRPVVDGVPAARPVHKLL